MGVSRFDAIVRSIYDAALDERAWQNLAGILARDLEGESSVIWFADRQRPTAFSCFNHSQASLDAYSEHFRLVDPWTEAVMSHRLCSTVFRGAELVEDSTLVQSEFYYDFLRKADILPNIGAHMNAGPGTMSAIGIHRPVTASPFKDRHKQRLQSLICHIEQMLVLRRHLEMQCAATEIGMSALHQLTTGIIICDANGAILLANATAEAIASGHGGIVLRAADQAIATDRPEQTIRLRQMIAEAAAGFPGGALCLYDEAGDRLLLVISPLPGMIDESSGRALVAIRSEASVLDAEPAMLVQLFGLTVAEADLAWSLMQNQSLRQIRARRGVSENTIRTQLAHVLDKTGTANQRELVRLLSLVPAPTAGRQQ